MDKYFFKYMELLYIIIQKNLEKNVTALPTVKWEILTMWSV